MHGAEAGRENAGVRATFAALTAPTPALNAPMTVGLTGNPDKPGLWPALADLLADLARRGAAARLDPRLADGLAERGIGHGATVTDDLGADVVLSFGGDGTLLRTAHRIGRDGPPILGVNLGRLGFLTKVEVGALGEALDLIEAGRAGTERRMTFDVLADDGAGAALSALPGWALNDVVVDKSGTTSMIQIDASFDGRALNTYWADGLIVATPTGSTAYALSVGGPIVAPGTDALVVAPIAPHTLTARPVVLPARAELTLGVVTRGHPVAFAVDGLSAETDAGAGLTIRVRPSAAGVNLLTLPGRDYFATVRGKLGWGQGGVF